MTSYALSEDSTKDSTDATKSDLTSHSDNSTTVKHETLSNECKLSSA